MRLRDRSKKYLFSECFNPTSYKQKSSRNSVPFEWMCSVVCVCVCVCVCPQYSMLMGVFTAPVQRNVRSGCLCCPTQSPYSNQQLFNQQSVLSYPQDSEPRLQSVSLSATLSCLAQNDGIYFTHVY